MKERLINEELTNYRMKLAEVENFYSWREWVDKIPAIKFKEDWEVKVIPPFGGAMARFKVIKDDEEVSIYLDVYDMLGYYGTPYWEMYPYFSNDFGTERFSMNDTELLVEAIELHFKFTELNKKVNYNTEEGVGDYGLYYNEDNDKQYIVEYEQDGKIILELKDKEFVDMIRLVA